MKLKSLKNFGSGIAPAVSYFACFTALTAAPLAHAATDIGWVLANQPNATALYIPGPQYSFNSGNRQNSV
jgi:hypothetical protein